MTFQYRTKGVCARSLSFSIEDGLVTGVQFDGGCGGNTQGVSRLVEGMPVEEAIRRGAEEIIIIGGLGGRLDHTLSTLAILEDLHARGVYATLTDGQSRVRYLRSSSTLIARSGYKYLSVLAADAVVKGVDIEGCKYPLKRATLRRERQFAVSNELTGNVAFVSVRRGGVFIIESSD